MNILTGSIVGLVVLLIIVSIIMIILMATCVYDPLNWNGCLKEICDTGSEKVGDKCLTTCLQNETRGSDGVCRPTSGSGGSSGTGGTGGSGGSGGSGGTLPTVGCIRGTNITTWGRTYDSCDVEKEAYNACINPRSNPIGQWPYDALWDSRIVRGYDCGTTQSNYRGTTWENICSKALAELPIGLTYEKVGCNKL